MFNLQFIFHLCKLLLLLVQIGQKSVISVTAVMQKYEPNWDSLDERPLPRWYDEAKIGIFIHWGVYSVPSFGSEWFWTNWKNYKRPEYVEFMQRNYKQKFAYQDFAVDFTAELFNATQWALLFRDSGAKYVVLTSKHHDGFALWPSKQSFGWNAVDMGPKRDIIKELQTAIQTLKSMKFGLYYSLFEWFNRLYIDDKLKIFLQQNYVNNKVYPELTELVNTYRPQIIWSDGDWEAPAKYWKSEEFLAWLYNDSPVRDTVVTNDRWGFGTACRHGDFFNCADRYNPGKLQEHKWENAFTLDKSSWGQRYDVTLQDFLTSKQLIAEIVSTVSCNGNVLINVGPTKYGTILPIFEERLRDMGTWLKKNGEAIYGSKPWPYQNDGNTTGVWYTSKSDNITGSTFIYAMILNYPYDTNEIYLQPWGNKSTTNSRVILTGLEIMELNMNFNDQINTVILLGMEDIKIKWSRNRNVLHIVFPPKHLIDKEGLKYAWTFKIVLDK